MIKPVILKRIEDYRFFLESKGISEFDIPLFRISWKEMFFIYKYFSEEGMLFQNNNNDKTGEFHLAYYYGVAIEVID